MSIFKDATRKENLRQQSPSKVHGMLSVNSQLTWQVSEVWSKSGQSNCIHPPFPIPNLDIHRPLFPHALSWYAQSFWCYSDLSLFLLLVLALLWPQYDQNTCLTQALGIGICSVSVAKASPFWSSFMAIHSHRYNKIHGRWTSVLNFLALRNIKLRFL